MQESEERESVCLVCDVVALKVRVSPFHVSESVAFFFFFNFYFILLIKILCSFFFRAKL